MSESVTAVATEAGRLLDDLGHEVLGCEPHYGNLRPLIAPRLLRGLYDDMNTLDDAGRLEPRTRRLARLGRFVRAKQLTRVRSRANTRTNEINEVFATCDALLTPVIAQPLPLAETWPPRGLLRNLLASTPWIAYTQAWNLTGHPAISVPFDQSESGVPVGIQLIGRAGDEAAIVALAAQLERARPWAGRRPAMSALA